MTNKIRILYKNDKTPRIKINEKGDWIDIAAPVDVEFKPHEAKLIPLDVAMQLPDGYEAHVLPRSSTFKHYGLMLVNSMGIIDSTYNGPEDYWAAYMINMKDEPSKIPAGERFLQFRVMKTQFNELEDLKIVEVANLKNNSRGGFGSTGR